MRREKISLRVIAGFELNPRARKEARKAPRIFGVAPFPRSTGLARRRTEFELSSQRHPESRRGLRVKGHDICREPGVISPYLRHAAARPSGVSKRRFSARIIQVKPHQSVTTSPVA
jgi:hypothetical protein